MDYMRMVSQIFPEAPVPWREWPARLEVFFTFVEGTCVSQALYDEYAVGSIEPAGRKLFDKHNDSIFVGYRLHTETVIPALQWYVSWPLLRRGSDHEVVRRGSIRGVAPWEMKAEDTLLSIWNEPRGVWGFSRVLMLRTGGRDRADAVSNWTYCARYLRRIYHEVRM
jgi:hypothetical protein